MAKRKKADGKKGLDEWMATYSDMVTLLMCFFVLLYASSTPDETKWQYIFQSFATSGEYVNPFVDEENPDEDNASSNDGNSMDPVGDDDSDTEGPSGTSLPGDFQDFSAWFTNALQSTSYADSVSVEQTSSTRICIRFKDSIMFHPDSAVLLDSGKEVVSLMLPGIKAISEYIKKIQVSGHTASGVSVVNDWDLSAARACSVLKFMDYKRVVDSSVYIAEGRGSYDPIASNETEEGRAQNRRVELVLVRNDKEMKDTAVIQDILKYDYGINQAVADPDDGHSTDGGPVNSDAVQQIIDELESKYSSVISDDGTVLGEESGPTVVPPVTGIPDSVLHEVDEEGNIITDSEEASAEEETDSESTTASE